LFQWFTMLLSNAQNVVLRKIKNNHYT
jgi:hypothetical protein